MSERPGPTGLYPEGKLQPGDEGELNIGITHDEGKVIMTFGSSVKWLAMLPDQAQAVASALLHYAEKAERELVRSTGH